MKNLPGLTTAYGKQQQKNKKKRGGGGSAGQ